MIRKETINGVYTISGIDSSSQLEAFYNEVVADNIEKYVGISPTGRRFKFDPVKKEGVLLPEDELFAINPSYIPTAPVEETIAEIAEQPIEAEVPVVEAPIEPVVAAPVVENWVAAEPVEVPVEQPAEPVYEEAEIVNDQAELISELNRENAHLQEVIKELTDKNAELTDKNAVLNEALNQNERDLSEVRRAKLDCDVVIEQLKAENHDLHNKADIISPEVKTYTIDDLFAIGAELGYKVMLTK